jgi:hypothetical protein
LLPPDFEFFSPIGTGKPLFVALVKGKKPNLLTFTFTDVSLGYRYQKLFEVQHGRISKLSASKCQGEFVAALGKDPVILFWSRGCVKRELEMDEKVKAISEWKARHKAKLLTIWIVCTETMTGGRLLIFAQSRTNNEVSLILPKTFDKPILGFTAVSPVLAFLVIGGAINGISLETGALIQKGKTDADVSPVVAIDSSERYVAALADQRKFSLFEIVNESDLNPVGIVEKPALFGRIKIIDEFLVVTARMSLAVYIYAIRRPPQLVRQLFVTSPVTSVFRIRGKALCCCLCGEMYLVDCQGREVFERDISAVFSFGHSILSLTE